MKNESFINGVTLVELAIVIVIIGLLIVGVLTGKTLIEQAEIDHIISQLNDYNRAITTFEAKYKALPGDFKNAKLLFSNCNVNPALDPPTTCDGDGDGIIGDSGYEREYVFTHLVLAGLISGNFNYGTTIPADAQDLLTIYPLLNDSFFIKVQPGAPSGLAYNNLVAKNIFEGFMEGRPNTGNTDFIYAMDQKIDDGNAKAGSMRLNNSEAGTCYDDTTGQYILSTVAYCSFAIKFN